MTPEEELYQQTGNSMPGAAPGQLFGKPCYKVKGKAFIIFFQNCLVCKLSGETHREALALDGAVLFDPSGKGRPMKEWVQLPYHHHNRWKQFAEEARKYAEANA